LIKTFQHYGRRGCGADCPSVIRLVPPLFADRPFRWPKWPSL